MEKIDFSTKSVLVYDCGLFTSLAHRLAREFGSVGYFVEWASSFPDGKELMIGDGFDDITRVTHFWQEYKKYDLIVFPDVWQGDLQEYLRGQGCRVWGSGMGSELELRRWTTREQFKKMGLPVKPAALVTGTQKLREYLSKHDDQFVKISSLRGIGETWFAQDAQMAEGQIRNIEDKNGAVADIIGFICEDAIPDARELGYDGFNIDGNFPNHAVFGVESKDRSYFGKFCKYDELPETILKTNEVLGKMLAQYPYRQFFSSEVREKDGKGYVIDLTCFSDDTEVLTNNGWKLFKNLQETDSVATLEPTTRQIEYHVPYAKTSYWFDGDMVKISNKKKTIECLVTPNHSVWRSHGKCKSSLWEERADSLSISGFIPRTGKWIGNEQRYFTLPEYRNVWSSGRKQKAKMEKFSPALKIEMDLWLKFLGIFISEGSVGCHGHQVGISQFKHKKLFRDVLKKLPFKLTETRAGFHISSIQLASYCQQFGKCQDKFVPHFIKELSPRQIGIFLEFYGLGDGSHKECGRKLFFTTSDRLADDVQELILKMGDVANIKTNNVSGTSMVFKDGKKSYQRNYDIKVVEWCRNGDFWFETGSRKSRYISKQPYSGMVYDVTVQNHILYVRRNGKPFWSGNCRMASPAGEVYCEMFENLAEILWFGAEGKLVDPISENQYGAQIILISEWAESHYQPVKFPEEIRPFVKLYNSCRIEGVDYVVPQLAKMKQIGSVVALGNTPEEAVKKCKALCDQIEGYDIESEADSLDSAVADMEKEK
jgi:hypothetical protein